jgi:tRNA(fMet)-specific endonuclease VapC
VSSPRFLLDTNILIYIRQRRPPEVLRKFARLQPGEAALSVVTYGELLYGAERVEDKAAARAMLEELISLIPVLPLPVNSGVAYGRIRAFLSSKGQLIGNNDLWIAAHAVASELPLVTNNVREFNRVPGLKVENWTRS